MVGSRDQNSGGGSNVRFNLAGSILSPPRRHALLGAALIGLYSSIVDGSCKFGCDPELTELNGRMSVCHRVGHQDSHYVLEALHLPQVSRTARKFSGSRLLDTTAKSCRN